MDNLDSTAQKLLQKDPANPNSPKKSDPAPRPGLGLSKSTMTSSKPSLREAMLAQKKAISSRNLPPRPGSAMATISPVRSNSGSSQASTTSTTAPKPATRTRPETTSSHGGISVAPMRPARRRPEMAARPATAGPYSVRSHDGPSTERSSPGESVKHKTVTPKTISGSPRRTAPRIRPGHAATLSETSVPTPSKPASSKAAASPKMSPARPKPVPAALQSSSPSQGNEEDLTLVVPSIASLKQNAPSSPPKPSVTAASPRPVVPTEEDNTVMPESATPTTPKPLKVYEDPFTAEEAQQPTPNDSIVDRPVLEDKPVNETTANLSRAPAEPNASPIAPSSPEKARQNSRLLDSGIVRVKAQTLDVHGFRKLQSLIRGDGTGSSKSSPAPPPFADDKFDALLVGLFAYLESPLDGLSPEKVQDVKAQVLATIKLLLKKHQDRFQPHIARGLEALLAARARYQARTHIVSGLELLADELVAIGDAAEILATMTRSLEKLGLDGDGTAINGNNNNNSSQCRSLSMGLHILRQLIELHGGAAAAADSTTTAFVPTDTEVAGLTALCARCLESAESAVRMDAVQLCVALHARLGEARFWDAMRDVREDPKSLITYYVVKRQRERGEGPVA